MTESPHPAEGGEVPPDIRRALAWLVRELVPGVPDPVPEQLLGLAVLLTGAADRAQDALHAAAARLYLAPGEAPRGASPVR